MQNAVQPTILLAEDSAMLRGLVRDMLLACAPFTVLEAANGSDALAILQQHPIDLVVSDWNMRPIGGAELLAAMRSDHRLANIPLIVMSGDHPPQKSPTDNIVGYLSKPFGRDRLVELLSLAFGDAVTLE